MIRLIVLSLLTFPTYVYCQTIFWTEDFGSGCNQGQTMLSYPSPNGNWTVSNTGANAGSASVWYVSAAENGNEAGECGSGCGADRTLHMGAVSIFGTQADPGAAYYEGIGFCGIFPCGATDKRAQSPTINCLGKTDISINFVYIEGGNTIDNATLWYFNGANWSQLADLAKTFSLACSPQGLWTNYTIVLPASANDNPSVKIGFRWVNNEDGNASDPSFAVDDISLTALVVGDTMAPTVSCPPNSSLELDAVTCQSTLPDFIPVVIVSDDQDINPIVVQTPPAGTFFNGSLQVTITATDIAGNSSSCSFDVIGVDAVAPEVLCTDSVTTYAGLEPGVFVYVPEATATDDCSTYSISNSNAGGSDASGYYLLGITDIIFTATDSAGNNSECTTTITVLACCSADFNCDGIIGVSDLLFLVGNIGVTCEFSCPADLNGDGVVGVTDQLYFLGAYGTSCP